VAEGNRGEIWQFSFPRPDRRRPVLVLTRQDIIAHLHNVTVAPITTTCLSSGQFQLRLAQRFHL